MPEPKSPFKRVRRAFERDTLKQICEMHEMDFAGTYGMSVTQVTQRAPSDFYNFLDRGSNILAVAHLDTVVDHDQRVANYLNTAGGLVIHSGALDDRLGAYTILDLLPKLGVNVDVLLTVGEEEGRSTAAFFDPKAHHDREYHWMIEFDRGGTDVVMYQYDDRMTRDLVRDSGARVADGIFSDISYMEHLEVKGFNWGVGYQDYHSVRGYAYLDDYWDMVGHFLKFHDANADTYLPHEDTSRRWGQGLGRGDDWWTGGGWRYDDDPETEAEILRYEQWLNAGGFGDYEDFEGEDLGEGDGEYFEGGRATITLDDDLVSEDFATVNSQLIEADGDAGLHRSLN